MDLLLIALEGARLGLRLALGVVSVGLLHTALTYFLSRRRAQVAPEPIEWPRVTVQLPMKDEFYVARRVIHAVGAFDYPRDRFDIQILDDSIDETRAVVERAAEDVRALGVEVEIVRRRDRSGFKAGHLAVGLTRARGELIAIFDADFVPPPEFLRRTIPLLAADPKLAMVQARWSFLNREHSILTRAQALILDALMVVEQASKSARGWPFQFNGSAGVWRRAAIDDAGGWRGDCLVEDLDLSYRAILKGWRLAHLADLAVPTELPETMSAFRAQQRRWTIGNAQLLARMWLPILRGNLRLWHRLSMLMHLGGRAIYIFIALLAVTMPLVTFGHVRPRFHYSLTSDVAVFATLVASMAACFIASQRATGRSAWSAIATLPAAVALHIGMSLLCATSFVQGLFSRGAVFIRTPKNGATSDARNGPSYTSPRDLQALLESLLAIGCGANACRLLERATLSPSLLVVGSLYALLAISFAWVGFGSMTFGSPRNTVSSAVRSSHLKAQRPASTGDAQPLGK